MSPDPHRNGDEEPPPPPPLVPGVPFLAFEIAFLRQDEFLRAMVDELRVQRQMTEEIGQQIRDITGAIYMMPVQQSVMITILLRLESS